MATPYEVTLTPSAYEHIKALRRYDRNAVLDAIKRQLVNAPSEETRNRKLLRKNPFADWELRVGRCRVLYDVDEDSAIVRILAVGTKEGNRLTIGGKEVTL